MGRLGREPCGGGGGGRTSPVPQRGGRGGRDRHAAPRHLGVGQIDLVAGLVRSGLGYLTDELAAVDLENGRLVPYPKPITVKAGELPPPLRLGLGRRASSGSALFSGQEWQVAVGGDDPGRLIGSPCAPAFVAAPHYAAGASTTLTPLSDTQAFFCLAVNAVNLVAHGSAGTHAMARLARSCRCYSLIYSDLGQACRLVLELAGCGGGG